jgi:hypothetical protein
MKSNERVSDHADPLILPSFSSTDIRHTPQSEEWNRFLESVGNGAEDLTDLRPHQDQNSDNDDSNQRNDKGIFHQPLATLGLPQIFEKPFAHNPSLLLCLISDLAVKSKISRKRESETSLRISPHSMYTSRRVFV